MLLQLQNATLRRPGGFVLANLNWTLQKGEQWAILGPSGSGKSLFLDALAGKVRPSAGRLQYGEELDAASVEAVARDYSFDWRVAGAAQFYQQRFNAQSASEAPRVRDLLQNQLRPVGTIDPRSVAVSPPLYPDDWLAEVADQMRITHLLDRPLTSLSNGETRRTLLTRSLLRRPRVLLLDNPFSGLDTDSRTLLHQTIDQIAQTGVSLVMVVDERDIPACVTHTQRLETTFINPGNGLKKIADNPTVARLDASFVNAVQMRNIQVRYGEKTVLDGIDWTVRRGEKWALLGPNGSGKSTLLSLITADNPQAYANDLCLFDRRRGTGESIWSIKQRIGFVSPELHLYFPRQTRVFDVVASGLFDTMGLFRKLTPEYKPLVESLLHQYELAPLQERSLSSLSLGQQRWALLVRALIKHPPLLVLDEPMQGLDAEHVERFRTLIENRCRETPDQTLIYVTHYPDELPRCITHTLRLAEGKILRKNT